MDVLLPTRDTSGAKGEDREHGANRMKKEKEMSPQVLRLLWTDISKFAEMLMQFGRRVMTVIRGLWMIFEMAM